MNPLNRVFLFNRFNLIYLLTALAVVGIITSSISLAIIYLGEAANRAIQMLGYHLEYLVSSTGTGAPWIIDHDYSGTLRSNGLISKYMRMYAEAYEIRPEYLKLIFVNETNRTTINIRYTTLYTIYVEGLKNTYLIINRVGVGTYKYGESKPVTGGVLNVSGYYNVSITNNEEIDLGTLLVINYAIPKSFIKYRPILHKDYVNATRKVLGKYTSALYYSGDMVTELSGNLLEELISKITRGSGLIFITGSLEKCKSIHEYLSRNYQQITLNVYVTKIIGGERQVLMINGHVFVVYIILLKTSDLLYTYSVQASLARLEKIAAELDESASLHGYVSGILNYPLYDAVSNMGSMEFLVRLSVILSLLPALVIVWISASYIPPAIISMTRRQIALLRIRGISLSKIKSTYTLALIIYVVIGSIAGIPFGPLIARILYPSTPLGVYQLVGFVSDPYALISIIAFVIILMIASIRKSFHIIRDISPVEYTRPTLIAETPIIKKGLTRGTVLLLILSIYYLLRILDILDPYKLIQNPIQSPLLGIAIIFMLILEPIMLFFGQVILIYTVARVLISYPETVSRIIAWIGGFFTKKFKALIGRFVLVKPARISLSIIISSFALSILLLGLLGTASSTAAFTQLGKISTGDVDYLIYTYAYIPHNESLKSVLENISRTITPAIDGSYTYMLIYIGETTFDPENDYTAHSIPVYMPGKPNVCGMNVKVTDGYILYPNYIILVPDNYTSIVYLPQNLLLKGDYRGVMDALRRGDTSRLFIVKGGYELPENPSTSVRIMVKTNGTEKVLKNAEAAYLRNLPAPLVIYHSIGYVIGGFKQTSISFGPMSRIEIVLVNTPGLVVNQKFYDELKDYFSSDRESCFIVAYMVKGSVNADRLPGTYHVYRASGIRDMFSNAADFYRMSFDTNTATGLSLFILSLIIIALLSYTIIYENLYTYTLLRGRGVSSRIIYRLAVAEAVSISLFAIIPGVILGIILAYGLPTTSLVRPGGTGLTIQDAYGVRFTLILTPISLVYIILIPLLIVFVSWIIIYLMYRRVAREAIQVIGSHI